MSAENTPTDNASLVQRFFDEVWNRQRLDLIDEIFIPDALFYASGTPVTGTDLLKHIIRDFLISFPDVRHRVEDLICQDDKVACRWSGRGTHAGEFMGVRPTDKEMTYTGMAIFHCKDGKVVSFWISTDMFDLWQQLTAPA